LIIEVKSAWTYGKQILMNNAKRDSVIKKKINFQFMIFDRKGNDITDVLVNNT